MFKSKLTLREGANVYLIANNKIKSMKNVDLHTVIFARFDRQNFLSINTVNR